MPSLNKVILIGHMTKDPEIRTTANGTNTCSFSIGVTRKFKNAQGQYESDFINIVTWRQQAEFVGKYFHKGNAICIVGALQTRNYTNSQGQKVYVTEVLADEVSFAESRNSGTAAAPAVQEEPSIPTEQHFAAQNIEEIPPEESLPF